MCVNNSSLGLPHLLAVRGCGAPQAEHHRLPHHGRLGGPRHPKVNGHHPYDGGAILTISELVIIFVISPLKQICIIWRNIYYPQG